MFIIIEWIDWSWKSTQIKLVKEKLEKAWKKVKLISYPRYSEDSSFMVRKYLNWEYWDSVWAKQASIFYAIDRFDSSFELKKDLENYDYIISDRYVSANMLHQAWKINDIKERNIFLDWLYDLEYNIFALPKPDKVLFLDVSPDITIKNMVLRSGEGKEYIKDWKTLDIHESDKNHLINAYNTANDLLEKYSDWVKVNCVNDWNINSIEEINKQILNEILK